MSFIAGIRDDANAFPIPKGSLRPSSSIPFRRSNPAATHSSYSGYSLSALRIALPSKRYAAFDLRSG
jgi:hypothetical protein